MYAVEISIKYDSYFCSFVTANGCSSLMHAAKPSPPKTNINSNHQLLIPYSKVSSNLQQLKLSQVSYSLISPVATNEPHACLVATCNSKQLAAYGVTKRLHVSNPFRDIMVSKCWLSCHVIHLISTAGKVLVNQTFHGSPNSIQWLTILSCLANVSLNAGIGFWKRRISHKCRGDGDAHYWTQCIMHYLTQRIWIPTAAQNWYISPTLMVINIGSFED